VLRVVLKAVLNFHFSGYPPALLVPLPAANIIFLLSLPLSHNRPPREVGWTTRVTVDFTSSRLWALFIVTRDSHTSETRLPQVGGKMNATWILDPLTQGQHNVIYFYLFSNRNCSNVAEDITPKFGLRYWEFASFSLLQDCVER